MTAPTGMNRQIASGAALSLLGLLVLFAVLTGAARPLAAADTETVLPRVIIALLDGDPKGRPRHHRLHYMATM